MPAYALFDGANEVVCSEGLKQPGCQCSDPSEVSMTCLLLLFSSQQLHEDSRFALRKLFKGIASCG